RRRAQHLRHQQRARAPRHAGAEGREWPGRRCAGGGPGRHRHGADGHHDARHGRLRNHPRNPRHAESALPARHRVDRQGDEGRPREMHRSRCFRLHRQARTHRPVAVVVAPMVAPLMKNGAFAHAEPANVLLVDDNPARLLSYRTILEPLGERLVEAPSGTDALRTVMETDFAVIVLDVNMPGMDGFETASLIHQHPRFEKTPIIFVSAINVSDMDRLQGYKLGAVDYVMVPIIPEILRGKVAVLAELFRKRCELQRLNGELADTNARLARSNEALRIEREREVHKLNEALTDSNVKLAESNRELKQEVDERRRIEERLREADRRKDEFLATLAHELRNPLAPIQSALNVYRLGQGVAGAEGGMFYRISERQTRLLVHMVDDLLDVSRITRGRLQLRLERILLSDILAAAIETAQPLIDEGQQRLE